MSDINKSLDKLINFMFIKYSGCLIERCGDKFKWGGETFSSLEEAKREIDRAGQSLLNSIKN